MNLSCLTDASATTLTPTRWTTTVQDDSSGTGVGYFCATVALVYLLIGTPWNGLVISVIISKRLWLASASLILLLNLMASNFLVCVTIFPFIIITGFSEEFIFGSNDASRCGVCWLGTLNITLPVVSLLTLSLLSVDRLIYVKKPFLYSKFVTSKRVLIAIVLVWLLSIIISVPPFFGFGTIQFSYVASSCVPYLVGDSPLAPNYYYAMLIVLTSSVSIVTLVVSYVWIVFLTRRHLLRKEEYYVASCSSCTAEEAKKLTDKETSRKQFRMVQLFGAIFTANLVTWIPMLGLAISAAVVGLGQIPAVVYSVTYLAFLAEIVIHPIIEAMLIRDIREIVLRLATHLCRRRNSKKATESMTLENGVHNKSSLYVTA